ncbi:nuclear inhibitor of protein phosphatase 1-like [Lineus longissimus]|uniref:nuclear inhibitor of protein phosphatase 1-like n=1 Tax=Lineus longissimus TaxID=88925 RepID=UPI002B4F2E79
MSGPLVNNFEVPSWAGKPPPGLHLDVTKDGKMVQKLMIDEKKCYFFGRNKQLCDFPIDHQSCSRVHSALIWHKHLARPFIIDLGSTHGTYIGSIRLENKKPQAVPLETELHFGASTRKYLIRERPQSMQTGHGDDDKTDDKEGGLLGLPETETELDNLTEFNTAHNRRVTNMGDLPDNSKNPLKRKRASTRIKFNEDEEIINPEDIDPTIGRFRNLIQTKIVPTKKMRLENAPLGIGSDQYSKKAHHPAFRHHDLYSDLPGSGGDDHHLPTSSLGTLSIAAKLGLPVPNLAPDIEPMHANIIPVNLAPPIHVVQEDLSKEPKKKKYAKEAWPGKKPAPSLLV